ncbi:MAG TPA: DUF481 domain-containing protein [Thermoanaerobaculia bacterium]|nr:DUF481 domain-containing protein [Thermoanaerobaculia bacterium]
MTPFRTAKPCLAAAIFLVAAPLLAQKTDVIELEGGDRITGEIKEYDQGRLTVDTAHSSWIKIKWSLVRAITSDKIFDVETIDGVHHFGTLSPSDPRGKLTIGTGPDALTVGFFDVFDITPVYQTFWKRWEGSLDLGFNYTQSSNLTQFNLDFNATYRMTNWQLGTSLSSFFSRQNGVTGAERGSFGVIYDRFLSNRWILEGGTGLDRNIQLGLKIREFVGVGAGRYIIQTNQTQLQPYVGVTANHEVPVEGETIDSVEGVVGCRYTYFMYDFPKLTISSIAQVFPSFTVSGRVRVEFNASVKREIISDFYMSLSLFDSFDSKDPTTEKPLNDWGPTVSIGWQF